MNKEQKKRRIKKQLQYDRNYHEKYNIKRFASLINGETLDALNEKLKERGMNKRQFLESAVDQFLKGE